jgi:hypothetical protein
MRDQDSAADGPETPGTTRRGMLRGAGFGVAGLAVGALAGTAAGPAGAAAPAGAATMPAKQDDDSRAAGHDEPLVVHVHDARTGVVDLYTGTRHVRFTDRQLAARLARAAS